MVFTNKGRLFFIIYKDDIYELHPRIYILLWCEKTTVENTFITKRNDQKKENILVRRTFLRASAYLFFGKGTVYNVHEPCH